MSTHRDIEQKPRYLTGVIDVDGALYRIERTEVTMTAHPSGKKILAVDETKIKLIRSTKLDPS
ncbi:hypothetical protein [Corynebacterium callunae]|uniref:Uncharacterized protein n=1 Tax=Corynebacterium callunae DSM 20147 TaxID=1121353 RepID=M1UUE3_9CORY|nr:hypothetical protein [Corynebacterium callunae]AGG66902.1 hypothetical protein H924_07300 [Corynebacterium callunae DSM 20147]